MKASFAGQRKEIESGEARTVRSQEKVGKLLSTSVWLEYGEGQEAPRLTELCRRAGAQGCPGLPVPLEKQGTLALAALTHSSPHCISSLEERVNRKWGRL